jgi:hypothetical protein
MKNPQDIRRGKAVWRIISQHSERTLLATNKRFAALLEKKKLFMLTGLQAAGLMNRLKTVYEIT